MFPRAICGSRFVGVVPPYRPWASRSRARDRVTVGRPWATGVWRVLWGRGPVGRLLQRSGAAGNALHRTPIPFPISRLRGPRSRGAAAVWLQFPVVGVGHVGFSLPGGRGGSGKGLN